MLAIIAIAVVPLACSPIFKATCSQTLVTSSAGPITEPSLVEISGIHAGIRNPDVWWVHNDSGDTARVFALDASGALRGTYTFAGTNAIDWEDLTVVAGPTPGSGAIYAADIGDNPGNRAEVMLYRVVEPVVPLTGAPATATLSGVETLHLTYPDGPRDAETLMIDPVLGDIVIVAKSFLGGNQNVYTAPAGLAPGSTTVLTKVGALKLDLGAANAVTGGDVAADGTAIAIRTYGSVKVFDRLPTWTIANTLTGAAAPCTAVGPAESQGEAVGLSPGGNSFVTVSEGSGQLLHESSVP